MNSEEIQKQIQLLQEALITAQQQEQLEKERLRQEQELVLTLETSLRNPHVINVYNSHYRSDYVNLCRTIPKRKWNSVIQANEIPTDSIGAFIISTQASLPRCIVRYKTDAERLLIDEILNGPDLKISVNADVDTILLHHKTSTEFVYDVRRFFMSTNYTGKLYNISKLGFAEASSLFKVLTEHKYKIQWLENAYELISTEAGKQFMISALAQASDAPDYAMDLNGHKLWPFQRVGVKFLSTVKGSAILADEPGLGKSIQSIAYAVRNNKRTLFIVTASIKENWIRYFQNYLNISPKIFEGTDPDLISIQDLIDPERHKQFNLMHYDMFSRPIPIKLPNGDTTYKCLWIDYINKSNFDLIVFDEAHKIKNVSAERTKQLLRVKPKNVLALTGTPVLSRPRELFPILHLINPKAFPSLALFDHAYSEGKNGVKNVDQLRKVLAPIMLRRTKDEVMPDLPPVNRIEEILELDKDYVEGYNQILAGVFAAIRNVEKMYGNINGSNITIILTEILRLKQYLAATKTEYVADLATQIYDETESKHRKVIIFSQFVPVIRDIAKRLGQEAVLVDGSMDNKTRMEVLDKFQTDPNIHFFCASIKTANEGLNITAAGSVIFTDLMWTPSDHQQAEGRAYGRLNDPHSITSYYLAYKNTLEQVIQSLLMEKQNTINLILDETANAQVESTNITMDLISYLRTLKK